MLSIRRSWEEAKVYWEEAKVYDAAYDKAYNEALKKQSGPKNNCTQDVLKCVLLISTLSLFIIGCAVAAGPVAPGVQSAVKMGQLAVGFGSGSMLIGSTIHRLNNSNLEEKKVIAITLAGALAFATAMIMGGLGVAGIVSANQISWSIIGAGIAASLFVICCLRHHPFIQGRKEGQAALKRYRLTLL